MAKNVESDVKENDSVELDSEAETELDNDTSIGEEADDTEPLFDDSVPVRDRKLHTNPFDFIVSSINSQIEDKSIVLQDAFQRRRVWNDAKASRLIESLILNVPIPVCYFAEVDDGSYAVVDGQQRLTSIFRFIDNQYPLKGLKARPDLNKRRFHQLPTSDQRLIKSRTIRCIVILRESHPDIRFDVFERLNTATVSLNRQELRNSTYRGNLNDLIIRLCENDHLKSIRRASTPDKRMRDAELILRFLAFHYGQAMFRSGFTRHLDQYLDLGRKFSDQSLFEHKSAFEETISKAHLVFGSDAFRRIDSDGKPESQINSAVFDSIMLSFSLIPLEEINSHRVAIKNAFARVCLNTRFLDAISRATRDTSRLNTRLSEWISELNSIGVSCPVVQFGKSSNATTVS